LLRNVLFGDSISGVLGVPVLALQDTTAIPRPSTISASWLDETSSESATDPTLGSVTVTPKTLVCLVNVSRQLLAQSAQAPDLLGALMARGAVKAVDAALLVGAGGAEPLGIANSQGIQTQSGSTLALSGVLAAQQAVVAAGASDLSLSFVTTPSVRQTLAAREIVSTSGLMLWRNRAVADIPAFVSNDCAASTAVLGDFRNQIAIALFGNGAEIAVDKSGGFNGAYATYRLLMLADVAVFQSAALCKITSVS
jgi:HK97 family phage major capsid protein